MTKGILGKKLGMTQVFTPEGLVVPVTVIQAGPCVVLQKKDSENDGYEAIQVGFEDKKRKKELTSLKLAMPRKLIQRLSATCKNSVEFSYQIMKLARS